MQVFEKQDNLAALCWGPPYSKLRFKVGDKQNNKQNAKQSKPIIANPKDLTSLMYFGMRDSGTIVLISLMTAHIQGQ